eukprot:g5382.t1
MAVTDELRHLEAYITELHKKGTPMVQLYERVQHSGNVLPRLYLLMTVGGVYIKSKELPAKDILQDLVEMSKGVQHPMRGLFLRNYLSQMSKDKLPDVGSEYEGEGGNVQDAIAFVLQNFAEMNRLWVRMQNQGKVRNKKKRELERRDLRILVGTNLVRLSQLDGVDLDVYRNDVLPKILEQVKECKDHIAQRYLMEIIIQVFPDEYHLQTMEDYLMTCTQLREKVDVKSILVTLMDRIAGYFKDDQSGAVADAKSFRMLNEYVAKVVQGQPNMEVNDVLSLQVALVNFAINCYPGKHEYVDHVLDFCVQVLSKTVDDSSRVVDESGVPFVSDLLTIPLETYSLDVLKLEHYPALMAYLGWEHRKRVAVKVVTAVLDGKGRAGPCLTNAELVDRLFLFISPLIKDAADTPTEEDEAAGGPEAAAQFEREQQLVARLVHLMHDDDSDALFAIYSTARTQFGKGGMRRIKFTLVPLLFRYMRLAELVKKRELAGEEVAVNCRKVFQFVFQIITALAGVDAYQELALRLFLQAAKAADNSGLDAIAYEFFTRAYALYEDIANSEMQLQAISQMIGTLQTCRNLGTENYDTLIKKATQYSAKLLKKSDQCRIHVELFVDILNRYLYLFAESCPRVETRYLSSLILLIKEHLAGLTSDVDTESVEAVNSHFNNTLAFIKGKAEKDTRFAEIAL